MEGIELIAKERKEQIEKHGRTIAKDVQENADRELSLAARLLIQQEHGKDPIGYPVKWDNKLFRYMLSKPYKERLIIAGALLAAELDRLIAIDGNITYKIGDIFTDGKREYMISQTEEKKCCLMILKGDGQGNRYSPSLPVKNIFDISKSELASISLHLKLELIKNQAVFNQISMDKILSTVIVPSNKEGSIERVLLVEVDEIKTDQSNISEWDWKYCPADEHYPVGIQRHVRNSVIKGFRRIIASHPQLPDTLPISPADLQKISESNGGCIFKGFFEYMQYGSGLNKWEYDTNGGFIQLCVVPQKDEGVLVTFIPSTSDAMMQVAKELFEYFTSFDKFYFTADGVHSSLEENAIFRASKLTDRTITAITRQQVDEYFRDKETNIPAKVDSNPLAFYTPEKNKIRPSALDELSKMSDKIKEQELIIYGLEEGAEQWKAKYENLLSSISDTPIHVTDTNVGESTVRTVHKYRFMDADIEIAISSAGPAEWHEQLLGEILSPQTFKATFQSYDKS